MPLPRRRLRPPAALRDVDLDAFLHPKTIAVIGASEQSGEAEHRDDPQVRRVGAPSTARRSTRCTPSTRRCSATRCYASIVRRPRRHRPRDHPHRPGRRHLRGGAAAQGEVRGDLRGRLLRDRQGRREARAPPRASSCAAATSACSARTRTSTRSRTSATTSTARRSRSITQSGHQGRPVFQGQELGIRLTHWAPTGNEVDLEFADFARYFADQPEVGVVACYIEGFKDGRTLMLAADHAAQLRKPIVMVKVGRTDEPARSMAQSHTGHLTGSDAVTSARCSASSASPASTASTSCSRSRPRSPRTRPDAAAGVGEAAREPGRVRLRDLGRHRRAHGRHARRRRPAPPRPHEGDADAAARRADPRVPARVEPGRLRRPARRRRARPQDPRRDPRRPERRHPRRPDHRRGRRRSASRSRATSSRSRRPPTSRSSWSGARRRAPTTRTTSACSTAACRCSARSATA